VQQSSFDDYPRSAHARGSRDEVYLVPSPEPPAGIGETSGPVIAPAVANACFAGERASGFAGFRSD